MKTQRVVHDIAFKLIMSVITTAIPSVIPTSCVNKSMQLAFGELVCLILPRSQVHGKTGWEITSEKRSGCQPPVPVNQKLDTDCLAHGVLYYCTRQHVCGTKSVTKRAPRVFVFVTTKEASSKQAKLKVEVLA